MSMHSLSLFCMCSKLKQERRDYVIIPKEAWDILSSWYGGGPEFTRRAISNTRMEITVSIGSVRG